MKRSVFISYSHKDEAWKDRLIAQLNSFCDAEQIEVWHDRRIAPGSEWFTDIEAAIDAAAIAVCLISTHFLQSTFCTQYEVGPLLARREQYGLIVLPVLVAPCKWETVHWLRPIQMLPRDGRSILGDYKDREDEIIGDVVEQIAKILNDPAYQPPIATTCTQLPEAIDLTRLTYTGFELVGRDAELARLNLAWRTHDTHLIGLSGWGGVGKTTLVNKWLEGVDSGRFEGATKVLAWSFAGDIGVDQEPSTEPFIHAALEWFGDRYPRIGSPWSKAERLAELVTAERALLVLDGIEIFQSTMAPTQGRVTDPALSTLLIELSVRNPGLCVVTSRIPLNDLLPFANTVAFENLERLSDKAGRAMLRLAGVRGITEQLLEQASRTLNGHALAIRLLAAYLTAHPQQVRERLNELLQVRTISEGGEIPLLLQWIVERSGDLAASEALSLISVLDGVAGRNLLERLRFDPVVKGLNDCTHAMSDGEWQQLEADMRRRSLLMPKDERTPERLTTHPLIATYFGERLRASAPDAWSAAHNRLYEYYKDQAHPAPETLEQAGPALRAVYHGSRAGDRRSALELFWLRVDQGARHRAMEINAPGTVLSALRPFYAMDGRSPLPGLDPTDEAYLVNSTGVMLRSLGQLENAIALFNHALNARKSHEDWGNASKNAGNVAELALVAGRIGLARRIAEESVQLARKSGDPGQIIYCLTTYADVLHHAGKLEDAAAAFEQAEKIHRMVLVPKGFPIDVLYRLPGIRYCDYLLTRGRTGDVLRRVTVLTASGPDIRREETAYGLAVCAEAMRLDRGSSGILITGGDRINAIGYSKLALDMLRASSAEFYLPKLLVIRARNFAAVHDLDAASRDVERALVIAKRNHAALFGVDARIEQAQIEVTRGNHDFAAKIVNEIKTDAEHMGYGRAVDEVLEIERSLGMRT